MPNEPRTVREVMLAAHEGLGPDEGMELGNVLRVTFNLGDRTVVAVGRVIWATDIDPITLEVGIEFIDVDPMALELLDEAAGVEPDPT